MTSMKTRNTVRAELVSFFFTEPNSVNKCFIARGLADAIAKTLHAWSGRRDYQRSLAVAAPTFLAMQHCCFFCAGVHT